MTNPASTLKHRTLIFILLAILNVIVIAVMQFFAPSLKPFSIIGLEFAGSPEHAHMIVNAWHENGVLDIVYFVTGFDFLFMVTYSTFLWLACLSIAKNLSNRLSKAFMILAWLQPVAAVLDAIENLALYQIISGSWKPFWPTLAAVCAAPKFAIALTAVLACLAGCIYKIVKKRDYSNIG